MREIRRTLTELLVVAVLGLGIGLVANALNTDGLVLARNYFGKPGGPASQPAGNGQTQDPGPAATQNSDTAADPNGDEQATIKFLMDQYAIQAKTHAEVVEIYNDPFYTDGVYMMIDARDDDHYRDGHIPGAYLIDHFASDLAEQLDNLLPMCEMADQIIVYCNGGRCEDSIYLVDDLDKAGVDLGKVYVYAGGIKAWKADHQPVMKGAERGSPLEMQQESQP